MPWNLSEIVRAKLKKIGFAKRDEYAIELGLDGELPLPDRVTAQEWINEFDREIGARADSAGLGRQLMDLLRRDGYLPPEGLSSPGVEPRVPDSTASPAVGHERRDSPMPTGASWEMFISYNHQDTALVRKIQKALSERGLRVWDDSKLLPADRFEEEIQSALESCQAAAVFVGASGLGRYQRKEFEVILKLFGRLGRRIAPCLLPGYVEGGRENLKSLDLSGLMENQWADFRPFGPLLDRSSEDHLETNQDFEEFLDRFIAGIRKGRTAVAASSNP